ncbi:MAG: hypothetical protein JXN59_11960, partial [Anaerolineae bacterium]|nr:hypothetical protein [Anaerolineae bacterium]
MPEADFLIVPREAARFSVALEPAFNAIASLRLLNRYEETSGLSAWVTHTLAAMTPEQLHTHQLVFVGLYYVVDPDRSYPSFAAYVGALEALPAERLRDKLLDAYLDMVCLKDRIPPDQVPTREALLADKAVYLDFLTTAFGDALIIPEIEAEAHDLINDLPRMKRVVIGHLREMWEQYLAAEWLRTRPMLQEAVDAFQQVDFEGMSNFEAAQLVAGGQLAAAKQAYIDGFRRLVFVPSPHLGPYQGLFGGTGDTLWLTFGARLPTGMHSSTSALSRAELLVRLSALADDTRLRVLA